MPPPLARIVAGDSVDWRLPERVPVDLAAGLPALVRDHERRLGAADPQELAVILGRLMLHYRQPERRAQEDELVYGDWLDALRDYPACVVSEAARRWLYEQRFPPRIAELRDLCDELLARRERELLRLRFLEACVERHGGQVPILARRIGERLVDYRDRPTDRDLELWLRGEHDVGADRVWTLPAADGAAHDRA